MNQLVRPHSSPIRIGASACPHDCPSTCALEVEVLDERTIGRVRGAGDNDYTAGAIHASGAPYSATGPHPRPPFASLPGQDENSFRAMGTIILQIDRQPC